MLLRKIQTWKLINELSSRKTIVIQPQLNITIEKLQMQLLLQMRIIYILLR